MDESALVTKKVPASQVSSIHTPLRHVTITESRPYNRRQLLLKKMRQMDNLEQEMHQEFLRHARNLDQ
jgi:hypothetical protein